VSSSCAGKQREHQHLAAEPGTAPHFESAYCVNRAAKMQRRCGQSESCDEQRDQGRLAMQVGAEEFEQPDGSESELRRRNHHAKGLRVRMPGLFIDDFAKSFWEVPSKKSGVGKQDCSDHCGQAQHQKRGFLGCFIRRGARRTTHDQYHSTCEPECIPRSRPGAASTRGGRATR
jgi:hypothetical protein